MLFYIRRPRNYHGRRRNLCLPICGAFLLCVLSSGGFCDLGCLCSRVLIEKVAGVLRCWGGDGHAFLVSCERFPPLSSVNVLHPRRRAESVYPHEGLTPLNIGWTGRG